MAHDEHCGCGCGHHHHHQQKPPVAPGEVSDNQRAFLHRLGHSRYLPVARFTRTDSREEAFAVTALAPVFIQAAEDSMETVKEAGAFLQRLEDMGLITLDYDIPLDNHDYQAYKDSALYAYFCQTVREAAQKPGFMGDTPLLELGSMGLTEAGEQLAHGHCGGGCCTHPDH